jgi:predicted TIM-barrel fold metal-dependent hydrolase
MAKVFGIHTLDLAPGVAAEEWERYLREEFRPIEAPGFRGFIARADRGSQAGSYLLIVEFDSAETRDRAFPAGAAAEDIRPMIEEAERANARFVVRTWLGDWVALASSR